jgi:hypothetical protein
LKAPQRVYQPRDGSLHPLLLSLWHLCESSSSNSIQTSAHVRTRTLLRLPLTSVLGHYSELHSSSVIHPPLSTSLQSRTHVYQPHLELHVYLCYKFSDVHSDIHVSIHLTSLSPCLRTLFGPLSSSALRSEPLPSNSAQTSVSHSVLQV